MLRHGEVVEDRKDRKFIQNADIEAPPPSHLYEQWRRRYDDAVDRLHRAGIKTAEAGAEQYIELRSEWDRYIELLAPEFAFEQKEVDPALAKVNNRMVRAGVPL